MATGRQRRLLFPERWDLDDNPEVAELLHLKTQDFDFLRKQSSIAMEGDRYLSRPLALRRVKAAFQAVFYLVALRRQAFRSQEALAAAGRAEFEDLCDMYVPVLMSWFNTCVFVNYFRSVLHDASVESSFEFDCSLDNPSLPIFRLRLCVFLKILFAAIEPPSALNNFWPRLAGDRVYLSPWLASLCGPGDHHGARSVGVFSSDHETLAGLIVVHKVLIEQVLLRKHFSLLRQRDAIDSSFTRAASHFKLLASILACIFRQEFRLDASWSPQLFPLDQVQALLAVLSQGKDDAPDSPPVSPRVSPKKRDWSVRTKDTVVVGPLVNGPVLMRHWLASLLRSPLVAAAGPQSSARSGAERSLSEEENSGKGDWIVVQKDGAEIYSEPTTFNAPIGRLGLGEVAQVVEVARNNTWLQMADGRWLYGRTAFTGEPTVARLLRLETESEVFMVRAKCALYQAPFLHSRLRKKDQSVGVDKFAVVTILECVRIDHSSVFGIKFLRLPQGWLPDRPKANSTAVTVSAATVKEDGNLMYKCCSLQAIRPWTAPDWKSRKLQDFQVASESSFQVDLVIKTDDQAEWARMKPEGYWLPVVHQKLTSAVICRQTGN